MTIILITKAILDNSCVNLNLLFLQKSHKFTIGLPPFIGAADIKGSSGHHKMFSERNGRYNTILLAVSRGWTDDRQR